MGEIDRKKHLSIHSLTSALVPSLKDFSLSVCPGNVSMKRSHLPEFNFRKLNLSASCKMLLLYRTERCK